MADDLHPNCVLINSILAAAGLPGRVRILPEPAPTAVAAADQLGVDVAAIVNSLIFSTAERTPLLVLTSGGHRVDTAKVAALVGTAKLSRASADFVRDATGQPIGGVAPIGHPAPIRTLLDTELARFGEIWAAGGIPHAVFPVSYPDLLALTSAQPVAVA
ncbi:YbaK/EbsC family protein [Jatrophihabitans sp.]|uniref:YbaK/EbsC family protein n=1 Tax=Jatrophihabitans sp. TaxID=1932789 RepID=UPI002EF06EAA